MANSFPIVALLVIATAIWIYFAVPLYKYWRSNNSHHPNKCRILFLLFVFGGYAIGFMWLMITSSSSS
jgi:hypothetical protein